MRRLAGIAMVCTLAFSTMAVRAGADEPQVKLSRSGICHEKGTEFYGRTKRFEPFDSMEACIAAGGRPAKPSPFASQPRTDRVEQPAPATDVAPEPPSGGFTNRMQTKALLWGAGAAAVIGVFVWWQRRKAGEHFRGQAPADADQLLRACMGDRAQMERLINFEISREAGISREEAIKRAVERWRRDINRSA